MRSWISSLGKVGCSRQFSLLVRRKPCCRLFVRPSFPALISP
ncbi:MAG TPA: hypothetical protein VII74_00780 [Chthoniobacterales bacterium]